VPSRLHADSKAVPRNRLDAAVGSKAVPRNRLDAAVGSEAVPRNRLGRAACVALSALVAVLAAAFAAPAAQAADARYEGISADGEAAFFSTTDQLVPGDTDIQRDVYVRSFDTELGPVTREVSIGPAGGNNSYPAQYQGANAAGDKVFFSTKERLTAADTDNAEDVYVRDLSENKTRLVSAGDTSCAESGCGNANIDAGAVAGGIVDGGSKVFFVSSEQLSSADTDNTPDLYVRDLETNRTTLVSAADPSCGASCGNGPKAAVFQGASADGTKAIFTTAERLSPADSDNESDLYERDLESGETKLVSTPGSGPEPCPDGLNCEPSANSAISSDGSHVFFETNERASTEDSDESQDVYEWSGGAPALVSTGPGGGNGAHNALFKGSSASGEEVFFATEEKLTSADTDGAQDIYARTGGTSTELVSEGDGSCEAIGYCDKAAELEWVSPGGTLAVVDTQEPLTAEDEDESFDVYARTLPGGPTKLVSKPGPTCLEVDPECGNGARDATFAGASGNGSHFYFVTKEALAPVDPEEPLVPGDADEQSDVYERSGETTRLVSAGQFTGTGAYSGNGAYDARLHGVSEDGYRAFFDTEERLTEGDIDTFKDIYMRSAGGTQLISRGNDATLEAELAPPPPELERTDPESPDASTEPKVIGSEAEGVEATAVVKLYTTADCSGEPVATGSVEALAEGIAVSVDAGTTTTFRATVEAEGFVSPCSASALEYVAKAAAPPGEEGGGGGGGAGGGPGPSPAPVAAPAPAPVPTYGRGTPYVAPVTRITFGPAFKTRARRPAFRFVDTTGQPGTGFACEVDRGPWLPCSSPTRLKKLGRGKHVFEVRGVNAAGVWEAQPVKRAFKVVSGGHGRRSHKRHAKRRRGR
jgi:hypothetical protein